MPRCLPDLGTAWANRSHKVLDGPLNASDSRRRQPSAARTSNLNPSRGRTDGKRRAFEHACREADRKAAAQRQDRRLKDLRRLLLDNVSLERAWTELKRGDGQAPQALVEALMFSLRRGVEELTKPDALQRLSQLSQAQLLGVCEQLQNFKLSIATAWTPEEVDALAELWSNVRDNG